MGVGGEIEYRLAHDGVEMQNQKIQLLKTIGICAGFAMIAIGMLLMVRVHDGKLNGMTADDRIGTQCIAIVLLLVGVHISFRLLIGKAIEIAKRDKPTK